MCCNDYLLVGIRRPRKVKRITLIGGQCDTRYVRPQIEKERVQSSAQADWREDAETKPIGKEPGVSTYQLNSQLMGTIDFVNYAKYNA